MSAVDPKTHCRKCLVECLPEQFAKGRRICRKCNATRWNGRASYKKAYRAANKEHRRNYDIRWLSEHPGFWSRYRVAKKDKWRGTETAKEFFRFWRKSNPEKIRGYNAINAKRIRQATPSWADKEAIKVIYERRPEGCHVDHIIPLAGITPEGWRVSGLHIPINLQYLTATENRTKKNRCFTKDI
jgi:hypothetical protein